MAQTKPKAAQFYGVSDNGTDGEFLQDRRYRCYGLGIVSNN